MFFRLGNIVNGIQVLHSKIHFMPVTKLYYTCLKNNFSHCDTIFPSNNSVIHLKIGMLEVKQTILLIIQLMKLCKMAEVGIDAVLRISSNMCTVHETRSNYPSLVTSHSCGSTETQPMY